MIVRLIENGWEIIYHRAHALLAAQLAGHWCKTDVPDRFYETLAAISHHDDLEREWEEDQLTEAGAPLDFTLDRKSSIQQLTRLIEGAEYRGRWVALLTSMHVSFLNEAKRGQSNEWDTFLDHLKQQQQVWQEDLGIPMDDVEKTYTFMRWCDRCSLILCQHQLPANERALEITKGPDGKRYEVMQHSNGLVSITPWPFAKDKFTVQVEATYLKEVTFDSNDALRQALKAGERKDIEWTLIRPD